MLTDPKLRSQVDALWDKFWTGGLTNPLDAIEQFSYSSHRPEGFVERSEDRPEGSIARTGIMRGKPSGRFAKGRFSR